MINDFFGEPYEEHEPDHHSAAFQVPRNANPNREFVRVTIVEPPYYHILNSLLEPPILFSDWEAAETFSIPQWRMMRHVRYNWDDMDSPLVDRILDTSEVIWVSWGWRTMGKMPLSIWQDWGICESQCRFDEDYNCTTFTSPSRHDQDDESINPLWDSNGQI